MSLTIGLLLALSFLVSLLALAFLIWAVTNRQLQLHQGQAYTVFTPGEAGTPDDCDDGRRGHPVRRAASL